MKENIPNSLEGAPEHIPTMEELHSVFQELTKKEFTAARRLEDGQGIYFLEVTIPGESAGEVIEYAYTRKGSHSKNIQSLETEIHITYYKDGMPISGTSAARCINGTWKIL